MAEAAKPQAAAQGVVLSWSGGKERRSERRTRLRL